MSNISNGIILSPIYLIVILIVIVLLIALQIFLSMQKNKWLGLVIPFMCFFLAAFLSFGATIYTGEIIPIIIYFIIYLIPAIINLLIYFACKAKVKGKENNELEKMNIHDLD
jgi:hypothetical protein